MKTAAAVASRRGEQGSSLFEVTLALGLLAGVMGSIAGLFFIGANQVRNGRHASEALSVARSVVEEIKSWELDESYTQFGLDGEAATYTINSSTNTFAGKWQEDLGGLTNSQVRITITSLDPGGGLLKDASQIRVLVVVRWTVGKRMRNVRLAGVLM